MQGSVLITGASRGLGLALAGTFLEAGFEVIATHRKATCPNLDELSQRYPGKLETLRMDVADRASVQQAADRLAAVQEQLDILINNAALCLDVDDSLEEADLDAIRRQMDVNVYGPLRVTRAFLPLLEQSDRGILVNISSEAGSVGACWRDTGFGYCMSKAALNMQSRILEKYLEPKGIKVLAVHPGWMQSDMGGPDADIPPEEAANGILRLVASDAYWDTPMYVVYNGEPYPY
jgi:NAD(P)-dependent dehydrogenase (short-subunit alcohol dehydrogenase family)